MDPLGHAHVTDVARIEAQLAELWREASSGDQAVTRACKLNLVVACADGDEDLREATRLVARISETEPGRGLVIAPSAGSGRQSLDVYVSAHCHRAAGGAQVCSEQITLQARGEALELVPATVLQLLVEEMPVYTLWRRPRLRGEPMLAPLRDMSDRFIVNTAMFEEPAEQLGELHALGDATWKGQTADVTWMRLDPWREALASFFDGPAFRPCLDTITRFSVVTGGPSSRGGATTAGAYLAGWLASRLGWSRTSDRRWSRPDGGRVELEFGLDREVRPCEAGSARIEAEHDGKPIAFVARRVDPGSGFVLISVEFPGSCPLPRKIKLPERDEAALVCGTLQRTRKEPIFDLALRDASRMV